MNLRVTFALLALALPHPAAPTFAAEPAPQPVTVGAAWARATPPGTAVAAVYLTLSGGSRADRLVGAATPRAEMAQIHVVSEADGMAQMRPTAGVDVPARGSVALAPQGTHLMLMGLPQPLVAGERFPLTLQFEQAGKVDVNVEVRAPGTAPPPAH
ncbi:MAG: copper chaperone PCu(A)C [Proteobacteria bacterium]|nr:copper chaperone PCu(A)C [Pseudomonadota bacterium]